MQSNQISPVKLHAVHIKPEDHSLVLQSLALLLFDCLCDTNNLLVWML